MADYLSTNTPRIKVLQTGPRGTHHMMFRYFPTVDLATAVTEVHSICTILNGMCWSGTAMPTAEAAVEGSDVFLPIDWTAITVASSNDVNNVHPYGEYANFMGRTLAGSRVAFYLFNVIFSARTANNRCTAAEWSPIGDVIAALNASSAILCGIDQQPFVMKGYANTGINKDVAKKSRAFA